MKERRKQERRRWGRKVTYPFIDSEGVLVTKNRRRKIDRRDVTEEELAELEEEASTTPDIAAKSKEINNTSLDISESKVMELEEALQDKNEPASSIVESIKDLEEEILEATNIEAISKNNLDSLFQAASGEDTPIEKNAAPEQQKKKTSKPEKVAKTKPINTNKKSVELPDIDTSIDKTPVPKNDSMSIELLVKGKIHTVTINKGTCVVGRDPSCDIVIQNKFVSRAHATIMLKDGKFLVEDNSFNGTYIKFNNGQKIHVSKDEQTLISNGLMSMGKPVDKESSSVIEFKINQ